MRLFITKQSCNRLVVAGSIADEDALALDEVGDDCDARVDLEHDLEDEERFLRAISDCDSWDGTKDELLSVFRADRALFQEAKNSNEQFYFKRAVLAIEYLEIHADHD